MLRKLVLVAFLLFVVLPGLWLGIEHLRGRSQLAEVLADLQARGAVLDIDRILPPTPPPPSNGLPTLLAAVPALNQAGNLLPPAIPSIAPGRAIPPNLLVQWPDSDGTNNWAIVEAWVDSHVQDYEALHRAFDYPVRRQGLDFSVGFSRLLLPHLAPIKSTATALSLDAAAAAQRDDLDTAVADLDGLRILVSDLAPEPILISQLVRVAVASIASARAWSVSHAQAWDEAQLGRLQAALPSPDFATDMIRSLEGERAACYAELARRSTDSLVDLWFDSGFGAANGGTTGELAVPGSLSEASDLAGSLFRNIGEGLRRHVILPLWQFSWGDQALAFYLRCADRMLEANRAASQMSSLANLQKFDLGKLFVTESVYARLHTVLAHLMLPALDRALGKALRAQTEIHLQAADLAIRRYRLRQGRLPERLQDLVPDFLASVPLDGMDGQPLRYRRAEGDSYVLWSVGADLKDDGGDGSWPEDNSRSSNKHWWNARDAVLPQPATPEQIADWKKSQKPVSKTATNPKQFQMSAELMKRYGLLPKGPTNAPPEK